MRRQCYQTKLEQVNTLNNMLIDTYLDVQRHVCREVWRWALALANRFLVSIPARLVGLPDGQNCLL